MLPPTSQGHAPCVAGSFRVGWTSRFGMRHAMAIASFVASEGASAGHGLYRLWDAVVPGQSVRKS